MRQKKPKMNKFMRAAYFIIQLRRPKRPARAREKRRRRAADAMNYVKKLCILKQLASGFAADGKKVSALLTAEKYAERLTLSLALIGFAPLSAGRYRCVLCDENGRTEIFDVPSPAGCTVKRASDADISSGFCCAVCFVSGKVTPVAFGKCGDKTYDLKKLCALLDESQPPKAEEAPLPAAEEPPSAAPQAENAAEPYDDELVATENYYEFEKETAEEKNENREIHEGREEGGGEDLAGEDEDAQSLFRFAGAESGGTDARACYYDQVKKELDALFEAHPKEEELEKSIPLSKWVRVTFARNKYYTVGVICDEKRPKYICYGVPADSRGEPPQALKGYCSYLPLSLFDVNGKGYWMMYQDAETGECVKIARQ